MEHGTLHLTRADGHPATGTRAPEVVRASGPRPEGSVGPVTPRILTALLVPADVHRPITVHAVQDCAAAISDCIGGVLLDDPLTLPLPDGTLIGLYRAEDRTGLPDNPRLAVITTRLAVTDRMFQARAHGDVLILGTTPLAADTDIPAAVTAAAVQAGYPIAPITVPQAPAVATAHAPTRR